MKDTNRLYSFYDDLREIHMEYFPEWRFGFLMEKFFDWLWDTYREESIKTEDANLVDYLKEFAEEQKKKKNKERNKAV